MLRIIGVVALAIFLGLLIAALVVPTDAIESALTVAICEFRDSLFSGTEHIAITIDCFFHGS